MEASEALNGGDGGGQAGGGAQTGDSGQQQAPEIPAAIADRFGELDRSFEDRFGQLQEYLDDRLPQQQQQQGPQDGEPELYLDEQSGQIVDAMGRPVDPSQMAREGQGPDQKMVERLQGQMQQQMQEQIAPILEHFQDMRAAELEDTYPQLRDEKYAEKIVSAAEERAAAYGNPELGRNPDFIELVHLSEVGRQRAAEQQTAAGASETGVQLETDGVTNAGSQEPDLGDRIVKAGQSRSSFFGS